MLIITINILLWLNKMAKETKKTKTKKVKKDTSKTMQICPDATISETPCSKEDKKKATP